MPVYILRPEASVESPLGETAPAIVSVKASVGNFSSAEFTAYGGKLAHEGAQSVLQTSVLKALAQAQQISFSTRTAPDTTVTMVDGRSDAGTGAASNLKFTGFIIGGATSIDPTSFVPGVTAVGKGALLEQLRLDIYQPVRAGNQEPLKEGEGLSARDIKDGNIADRLRALTDFMIKRWDLYGGAGQNEKNAETAILKANRDRLNRSGPLQAWQELLRNSKSTLEEVTWFKYLSENYNFNLKINEELIAILTSPSSGFTQILSTLLEQFRLMWVPDLNGGVGKLLPLDKVVGEPVGTIKLYTSSFNQSSPAFSGLFPIKQVLMHGHPKPVYVAKTAKKSKDVADGVGMLLGSYPRGEVPDGDVLVIKPPGFMPKIIDASTAEAPPGVRKENFGEFISDVNNIKRLEFRFQKEAIDKMVEGVCKSEFLDATLKGYNLSVAIPLDLSLAPGARYRVANEAGEVLFTGFLNSVNHTLKRGAAAGDATTALGFSHIAYEGFQIPS